MITPLLGVMGRGEFRDALVWLGNPAAAEGADRLYITSPGGRRVGARAVVNEHVVVKAGVPLQRGVRTGTPDPERRLHKLACVDVLTRGTEVAE